jgi:ribosome-associated protein
MPITIPAHELEYRFSRSSGPGGQHVNKTSSRVEVVWSVKASSVLSDSARTRLAAKLGARIDGEGFLHVVAQDFRSQLRNREAAVARLHQLVDDALRVPKPRKPTKPTKGAREARLATKKRHARLKRERRVRDDD